MYLFVLLHFLPHKRNIIVTTISGCIKLKKGTENQYK